MNDLAQAATMIPRRHGIDVAAGRRTGRMLRLVIRGNPEPGPQRWQALGEGLMHGDPPADRLLEWMQAHGMRNAMPLFEQASRDGIASVAEAPAPLREFFGLVEHVPAWVRPELVEQGQRLFQRMGRTADFALRDGALMGGYQASAFNKTLILTGALNGGNARRVAETMQWVADCTLVGGLERGAAGYRSTLHVRLMHAMVRRSVSRRPDWNAAELGLPINQTDMAATYLGFCVVLLIIVRAMGVPVTPAEGRAEMHLWRYICWLMGVDERWLVDEERDGRILLYQMLLAQTPADETSVQLGRALMADCLREPWPTRWRARFESARHLSVTRLLVGSRGMQALGLPAGVVPWYPLLSAPFTLLFHLAYRLVPGGTLRAQRYGRRVQEHLTRMRFGSVPSGLGRLPLS
jgi:hypothetical protein